MIRIMTLQEIFINNLKAFRNELSLTQERLAEEAGVSSGLIGKIESKRTWPTYKTIEKISKALDIRPYMLFLAPEDRINFKQDQIKGIMRKFEQILKDYK